MRKLLEIILGASLISINMLMAEAVLTPVSPLLAGAVMLAFAAGGLIWPVSGLVFEPEAAA